jgi:cell envelope opacity-associated protein A
MGDTASWQPNDIQLVDQALMNAMSDEDLNNVISQYFPDSVISSTFLSSQILSGALPARVNQAYIEQIIRDLFAAGMLDGFDLETTAINFLLPKGIVLESSEGDSLNGLGGFHNSLHLANPQGGIETIYWAVGVYSETSADGTTNGIPVFDAPWKNIVATFYHELNEVRTDADVADSSSLTDPVLGWVSNQGEECGDFPVFEANPLTLIFKEVQLANGARTIPIQFQYSNEVHGPEGPLPSPKPQKGIGPTPRVSCSLGQNGDLHILGIDLKDGLWHTIRKADGSWPYKFGDVQSQTRLIGPNPGIGATPQVSCSTNMQGDLHVLSIDENNGLWHTIRMADGTWPFAFGDVQAQTRMVGPNNGIGLTPLACCATNNQGDLHVLALDNNGGLWHTIRMADGSWPFAFGDVQSQTRLVGPNPGIGPLLRMACATNQQGDLHVLALDKRNKLWHTIRMADGTWPYAFGDVQSQTNKVGPNMGIGPVIHISCACNQQGDLQLLAISKFEGLWHTIRMADGTWPFAFGDVQSQTRLIGPNPGIGSIPFGACSINAQGNLHVCAIDQNAGLSHTIRMADGTWPYAFGDVQSAIG